jgi:hypothetical protein
MSTTPCLHTQLKKIAPVQNRDYWGKRPICAFTAVKELPLSKSQKRGIF